MNSDEILRLVDQIHLERKIDRETVFVGIEQALVIAARKKSDGSDDSAVDVHIDRQTGEINAYRDNVPLSPNEIAERIGAQTAKQVIIQKIRDAERDMIYDEYYPLIGELVSGEVKRDDGSVTLVDLQNVEAILPRSEKIPRTDKFVREGRGRGFEKTPRENFRVGSRIRALVVEVKKVGARVKVVLSRTRPLMVQRLFEQEAPEIYEGVVEIKGVSREAGKRSKIAVASSDPRIDLVGACVGVRGARSRAVMEEINGERVDVVPWSSDVVEFIRNALKPAIVDEVILCSTLGRAIVLVQPDQRSLAIGRGGQNVRLASRLCDWDVDVMTRDDLDVLVEKAMQDFNQIEGVSSDLADVLVGEGFLSFDDLSIIETDYLMQLGGLTVEQAEAISNRAEELAEEQERQEKEARANAREDDLASEDARRRSDSDFTD